MKQIDFLPHSYRREHIRRRRQVWQFAAIALVTGIIVAASFLQSHTAARVRTQLDRMMPQYQEAQQQNKRLAELKSELKKSQDLAELFTYLRHPWPKTQILAAILEALPKQVTLEKISILRKLPSGSQRQKKVPSQAQRKTEEKRLASLSPAARDLEQIRSDVGRMQTELTLTGTTNQPASLHQYVGLLEHNTFFSKTQLESIESVKRKNHGQMKFELQLLVTPGYGQPDGPDGSPIARNTNEDRIDTEPSNENKS